MDTKVKPVDMSTCSYAEFVKALFVNHSVGIEGLLHGAIGLSGEAGEVLDLVKKAWVFGKPYDEASAKKELGDVLFYAQAFANVNGWTLDEVMETNRAKLLLRYPNGYSNQAALTRADMAQA